MDTDIILSEEEHKQVLGDVSQGKTLVILRGGKLIVNFAQLKYSKETEQPTKIQEEEKEKRLQLASQGADVKLLLGDKVPESVTQKSSYIAQTHKAFFARMKWPHAKTCDGKICATFKG